MADADTELGGPHAEFPRTTASLRDQLRNPDPAARQGVLTTLARRYWKPVYHFLRLTFAKGNEEAKDLTQAFFVWLLERDVLSKYDPRRSTFRTFFKGVLRNFAGNEHQAAHRLKRGGGARVLPLDPALLDSDGGPAEITSDPEEMFDQLWTRETVARAVERVRARYQSERRIVPFLAFEQYDLAPGTAPSYADLAGRLGVKESDVRNYLFEVRGRVRDEVKAELVGLEGEPDDSSVDWSRFFRS
jgi:RNA polymerase sigma-70 factor (ECF subfamily)